MKRDSELKKANVKKEKNDSNNSFYSEKNAKHSFHISTLRGVARGGPGGAIVPSPEYGRSVNTIQTRGADYAPRTTAIHPGFKKLTTPLI